MPVGVALWGAITGSVSLLWAIFKEIYERSSKRRERRRLVAHMHVEIRTVVVQRVTPVIHHIPTVVVTVANLGREAAIVESIEARSANEVGGVSTPGRYAEPEAAFGRNVTMLPKRVEPGEVADFPSYAATILSNVDLTIEAIDNDGRRYRVPKEDLKREKQRIERYEHARVQGAAGPSDELQQAALGHVPTSAPPAQ